MEPTKVIIKKERLTRLLVNKHPWIFSGAVAKISAEAKPGEIVQIADDAGNAYAQAAYNPNSDICLRVISWSAKEIIDDDWFLNQFRKLAQKKEQLLGINFLPEEKKNYRLAFSDADALPGLIIDRYGLTFTLQLQTFFADSKRELWVSLLKKIANPEAIYERSDVEVRKKEGLTTMPAGILSGALPGTPWIEEDNLKIRIDIASGQKTGFFLDLRTARKKVEKWCNIFKIEYLQNYFAYSGSFNLYAARARVKRIEHIESSETANRLALENAKLNNFTEPIQVITADCFEFLVKTRDESVGAIILDPPSFVKSRVKIENALEGYKRLNSLAMKKLKKGGLLFTFCCSSYISEEFFQKALFQASAQVRSELEILEKIGQELDHLNSLNFPEGRYFQGLVLHKRI